MIASTIAAFSDEVDRASVETYRKQVVVELTELNRLVEHHGLALPLEEVSELVGRFSADPTVQTAESLDRACHRLMSQLTGGGSDGS